MMLGMGAMPTGTLNLGSNKHACHQRTLLGVGTTLTVSSVRSPGACSRRRPPGGACSAGPGRGAIGANVRVDTPTWLGPDVEANY